jgi:MFS family permease
MTRGYRSRDFRLLWASGTVSGLGSAISMLAFPTIAVLELHAGPVAVGAMAALGTMPLLVLSMVSGVVADRGNRRRLLIGCDVISMVATGSIPVAAALGHLTIAQLFIATAVNGASGNLSDITFHSVVPSVVDRGSFDHANARLEAGQIATSITGPGLGGLLIQLFGAARAVSADAVSFLLSALLIAGLRQRGRVTREVESTFRRDLAEGARFVFGDGRLRRLAIASAVSNFGFGVGGAVLLIYLYRSVGLSPGGVGVIVMSTGIVGAVLAYNAPAVCRRFGYARTLAVSAASNGVGWLILPLAAGALAIPIVVVSYVLQMVEQGLWNVSMITLRRSFTPDTMYGRMVASTRTVAQGTAPLGAIIGGVLGATLGVVPTLMVGGALMAVCGSIALDPELTAVTAATTLDPLPLTER